MLSDGKVLSSNWSPRLLKGVVQERVQSSYRAGLVIKGSVDIDNLCSCRSSREAGLICAHSVAVGLRHLQRGKAALRAVGDTATPLPAGMGARPSPRQPEREPEPPPGPKLTRSAKGRPVEFFVSLPPDFVARIARGSVMARFEAKWQPGSWTYELAANESALRAFAGRHTLAGQGRGTRWQ